ncbi:MULTISPECIES: DUF58 domain-containing protein [Methylosinus]|uniref:DUF58 domain-containing protein n=1 Tax=Methylosinus trichosporium (strain ATCC 35070 / NCIMB 11131 / UNIQEM 75 / OB3b) TaxID=595536 RepID=A0A2D2D4X9_METT3|nr:MULTISPECIES: DUF58 domain-containing protein [Methylosinus]ATQ70068.1 DUF58 domain-containing protein [Methylosinus trichosporium OB3b]OBS54420.1 hypothetical protein A8B73_00675 [Methylosinus sp. 3S-1]
MAPAVVTKALEPGARIAASARAIDAADLAGRLPDLVIRAREVAASVVHGAHGRRRAGMGENFWQFRPFGAGEPAHRIDWRRSARDDRLFVREREWEAAHSYFLWMDCSPSMGFVSSLALEPKLDRALTLGLALADVLMRGGERVGLAGLTHAMSTRDIIERLAQALATAGESVRAELPPAAPLPAGAKALLFSDFLCDPAELAERLGRLAANRVTGALLMIADPVEESFPFEGETLFLDTDSRATLRAGRAQAWREAYAERLARHRDEIARAAASVGFSLHLHRTDRPAAEAALTLSVALASGLERV